MKAKFFILALFLIFSLPFLSSENFPDISTASTVTVTTLTGNFTNISQATDTDITYPVTDTYVLTWNATSSKWEAKSAAAVGDTNETTRFNVLVGTDCAGTDKMVGVASNGAVVCETDYATNTSYYLVTNPYGYYNSTNFNITDYLNSTYTLGNITEANTSLYNWIVAQGYTTNGISLADLLSYSYWNITNYGGIGNWTNEKGNYSTYANQTTTFYLRSNPYSYWNDTYATWNESAYWENATATFALIGSGGGITWADVVNGTVVELTTLTNFEYWNTTYYGGIGNWSEDKPYYANWSNITSQGYITNATMNKSVSCEDIFGGTDADFCVDTTGDGGKAGDEIYLYNDTDTIYFNTTLAGTNLSVNSSDYWDNYDSTNSTQFNSVSGTLTIIETWLETTITKYWNYLWGTKTTDDLPQGATNFYDNQSWNYSRYWDNASQTFTIIGASEVDPYWTGNQSFYSNYSNNTWTFLLISDWNATNTSYYLVSNPYGYYNISDFDINNYLNTTYVLGNITEANTSLYDWVVAQGYAIDAVTLSTLLGFGYYNDTSNIGNWTNEKGNYSTYANQTGLFLKISDWNATNESYYLLTNPYGYYNITVFDINDYLNSTYTLGNITEANTSLYNWIVDQSYTANAVDLSTLLGFSYWNTTYYGGIGNWSEDKPYYANYSNITGQGYLTSETDPQWTGNQSYYANYSNITGQGYLKNETFANFTQVNASSYKITEVSGNCDLTILHSICANSTGTYFIG